MNELDEETGLYYYGARYYDAKTSVWQSVDPLWEMYPNYSPYNYTLNNPITYIDPDGRKVVNADRLRLAKVNRGITNFTQRMTKFEGLSRRQIRAKFGDDGLKTWKYNKNMLKTLKRNAKGYAKGAVKTDKIIKKWKKESPNLFKKVDNMKVDLYLGVDGDNITDRVFGATSSPNCVGGEYQYRSNVRDDNDALDVYINSGVNLSIIDEETGEFSLNHEAGHFIFAVEDPDQYENDKISIEAKGEKYNGGHHKDASTGKSAKKHGSKKDL